VVQFVAIVAALLATAGCNLRRPPSVQSLELRPNVTPEMIEALSIVPDPPPGWAPDTLKRQPNSASQVWISPTGRTAYGVIHFILPLPVGHEPVLWVFLTEMRKEEGIAKVQSKHWDSEMDALRFVVDGSRYRIRTNLLVRGFEGWAVYAGTLLAEPVDESELLTSENARETTTRKIVSPDPATP
jgi:hypothetical protein